MNLFTKGFLTAVFCAISFFGISQQLDYDFRITALGVRGGLQAGNLSAYLLSSGADTSYICLDGGSVFQGLKTAEQKNSLYFTGLKAPLVQRIMKNRLKAFLISHPHLDHLNSFALSTPELGSADVYADGFCLKSIKDYLLNNVIWANFGDSGIKPALGRIHYKECPYFQEQSINGTPFFATCFPLSHGAMTSTAFLIRKDESYFLYLGDTGADRIENSGKLDSLWSAIAPLIDAGQLKAIMIEASWPSKRADQQLYGHLTPKLLLEELQKLQQKCAHFAPLKIFVTHIKAFAFNREEEVKLIYNELQTAAVPDFEFIIPEQGETYVF